MKNHEKITQLLTDIGFELELTDAKIQSVNTHNPYAIETFIKEMKNDYEDEISTNADVQSALADLEQELDAHKALPMVLGKDELKEVYALLKDRKLHPKGTFDSRGCFWLEDDELVDVRQPSPRYPYSQMTAGRTSKFVKAMAEKYKPATLQEFLNYFEKAN